MTNGLTIGRIDFSPLTRFTVGFDDVFEQLARTHDQISNQVNYPPYNIIKYGPNQFAIEIAVAGFDLEEIDIDVEGHNLTITGEKNPENKEEGTYVHKGISTRSFKRSWPLGENVEVKGAVIKNGMLTINLERIVPESMQPRKIAITSAK